MPEPNILDTFLVNRVARPPHVNERTLVYVRIRKRRPDGRLEDQCLGPFLLWYSPNGRIALFWGSLVGATRA